MVGAVLSMSDFILFSNKCDLYPGVSSSSTQSLNVQVAWNRGKTNPELCHKLLGWAAGLLRRQGEGDGSRQYGVRRPGCAILTAVLERGGIRD